MYLKIPHIYNGTLRTFIRVLVYKHIYAEELHNKLTILIQRNDLIDRLQLRILFSEATPETNEELFAIYDKVSYDSDNRIFFAIKDILSPEEINLILDSIVEN